MIHIKWVLAHEPIELFLRAAQRFTEEVTQKTNGEFVIECLTLSDYATKYNDGKKITKHDLFDLIESNKIQMSQTYTTWLGERYSNDMRVLDLPFLFRNHDHAAKVLDGEIGSELLAGLNQNKAVRGLAFTYSGGFRMLPGNVEINKIEDLKGLKVRSNRSPVAIETFKSVGAEPIVMELEDIRGAIQDGTVVAGESTYPRFYGLNQNEVCPIINDTGHSLFLTSILINQDFWDSLDDFLKGVVQTAALNAARSERKESVEDIELVRDRAYSDNIKVVELCQSEKDRFKEATKGVYDKFDFGHDYVQRIKNVH